MQLIAVTLVVVWAAWHVHGVLAPWQQRRLRAALARRMDPILPAALAGWLRPGPLKTGCGCGTACEEPGRPSPGR